AVMCGSVEQNLLRIERLETTDGNPHVVRGSTCRGTRAVLVTAGGDVGSRTVPDHGFRAGHVLSGVEGDDHAARVLLAVRGPPPHVCSTGHGEHLCRRTDVEGACGRAVVGER